MIIDLNGCFSFSGSVDVPGDKSITHRAIMFGALASGRSTIRTSLLGRDNFATMRIMRQLGIEIGLTIVPELEAIAAEEGLPYSLSSDPLCRIEIEGRGLRGLRAPDGPLDCGNSGTTARLLSGVLAAQHFESTLVGDASLSRRPFGRVAEPLGEMGAKFSSQTLPLTIHGGPLKSLNLISTKASAQVKSAVLLAGLLSGTPVTVTEPYQSRDHTERMLKTMGVQLEERQAAGRWQVQLVAPQPAELMPLEIDIPGDFSAAAFFLVAGSIFPDSKITIRGVGFNPTRTGLFSIMQRMGADFSPVNRRVVGGEEVVDLEVRSSALEGIRVDARDVVFAIDEIPALAVAAAFARGTTSIVGAEELRVKESDRLSMVAQLLRSFAVQVEEGPGSLTITGGASRPDRLDLESEWSRSGDHRIAMCGALMQLRLLGKADIPDYRAVETSFPGFDRCFYGLTGAA